MRDFKQMKRQRGRNRGGGNTGGGGGGGKPQQNANRAFDSNGPDNIKVRGHAQHVFEKYQQLARDATTGGDRVLAENFLQHAEHYFRVLRTIQPNRPLSDFIARDNFASGYDIDFEDESGAQALPDETPPESAEAQGDTGEQPRGEYQQRDNQQRDNQQRDGQQRDNQSRDGREPRQDRWENRGDRQPRDNQPRDNQSRDGQQRDDRPREDRGQNQGQGQNRDRNRYDRDRPRDDRPREDRAPRTEGEGGEQQPRESRSDGYRDRDRNYRDDRPQREDRAPREDRPAREDRSESQGQSQPRRERSYEPRGERSDPLAVVEPKAAPLVSEAPSANESGSVLRSSDGETSHAPAFLQAAPAPSASDEAPVKRPRGRPKKVVVQPEEA